MTGNWNPNPARYGRQREARPGRTDQTRRSGPLTLEQDVISPLRRFGSQIGIEVPPISKLAVGAPLADVLTAVNLLIDSNNAMKGA